MNDPRVQAQQELEGLLRRAQRGSLGAVDCMRLVEEVRLVPGFLKRVAHALSAQCSAPAFEALRCLPTGVPGVVEGLYRAIAAGVTRVGVDGVSTGPMVALDFRRSRSKSLAEAIDRARVVFGDAFEALRVGGTIHYRFGILSDRGTVAGRAAALAHDLQWLHTRLARLKGTRVWINGWHFDADGPIRAPVQTHLVRAWLTWAGTQTQTRGP